MVKRQVIIEGKESGLDEITHKAENLDKSLDKIDSSGKKAGEGLKKIGDNGGAISTLDSLTGGLATRIRDAAEATKVFNFSLKATRAALIATGIGAFVVALGLVIEYWDEIVDFVKQTSARLEEQISILKRKGDVLRTETELLDKQIELAKLQGKESDELIKKKRQLLQQQIAINGAELANLQVQRERLTNQAKEATLLEKILGLRAGVGSQGFATVTDEERAEIEATQSRIDELRKSILDAQIALQNLANGSGPKDRDDVKEVEIVEDEAFIQAENRLKAFKKIEEERFDITKQLQESALKGTKEFLDSDLAIRAAAEQKRIESERASAKIRKQIAKEEADAKIASYNIAANGFAAASQLIGKETAAGKAFAVASALVSTYLSANQAYQSQLTIPTPDAPIRAAAAAAVAVASGLANVKEILSVQIPGQGNSAQTTSPSQRPTFNVIGSSAENQINQDLLQQRNEPVEAFVVDKRVTSSQELRRNKKMASSF